MWLELGCLIRSFVGNNVVIEGWNRVLSNHLWHMFMVINIEFTRGLRDRIEAHFDVVLIRRSSSKWCDQAHILWRDKSREKHKLHHTSFLSYSFLSSLLNPSKAPDNDTTPWISDSHDIVPCISLFHFRSSKSVDVWLEALDSRLYTTALDEDPCICFHLQRALRIQCWKFQDRASRGEQDENWFEHFEI